MSWLCRVNIVGNWTGRAHVFDGDSKRAICGTVRTDDEDWRPAPRPLIFGKCSECVQLTKDRWDEETR